MVNHAPSTSARRAALRAVGFRLPLISSLRPWPRPAGISGWDLRPRPAGGLRLCTFTARSPPRAQ
eukprot:418810-Alexandrium_andersonii.AAC.1